MPELWDGHAGERIVEVLAARRGRVGSGPRPLPEAEGGKREPMVDDRYPVRDEDVF